MTTLDEQPKFDLLKYSAPERVYHYRKLGIPIADIAADMGMTSAEVVNAYRNYVSQMAATYDADDRRSQIMLELDRLDDLQMRAAALVHDEDKALSLNAIDKVLKIMVHRAKLLGLDQLTPTDQTVQQNILVVGRSQEEFLEALIHGRQQPMVMAGPEPDDESDPEAEEIP